MSDSEKLGESLHRRDWQQPLQETPFESDDSLRISSPESLMPGPRTSPPEDWRELAQRVQVESDPSKMDELVPQLIAKIDQERLPKPFRPTLANSIAPSLWDEHLSDVRADYSGNRSRGVTVKKSRKLLVDFGMKDLSNAVLRFQRLGPPHLCFAIENRL